MDEEIKNCPSCGEESECRPTATGMFLVICHECGMRTGLYRTRKEAIEAWNRRVEV